MKQGFWEKPCIDEICLEKGKKKRLPSASTRPTRIKCMKEGKCIKADVTSKLQECNGKCVKKESPCHGKCHHLWCLKNDKCQPMWKNWNKNQTLLFEFERVLYECDGRCMKTDSPCHGKCGEGWCLKDNKCTSMYSGGPKFNKLLNICAGKCIGVTEGCDEDKQKKDVMDGSCEDWQCAMSNGTCINPLNTPHLTNCHGKCVGSKSKCNGFCRFDQCEKKGGSCEYTSSKGDKINFGVCAGRCTKPLTKLSTKSCHGECEKLYGVLEPTLGKICLSREIVLKN